MATRYLMLPAARKKMFPTSLPAARRPNADLSWKSCVAPGKMEKAAVGASVSEVAASALTRRLIAAEREGKARRSRSDIGRKED